VTTRSILARFLFALGILLALWFPATRLVEASWAEKSPTPLDTATPVTRQEVWQAVEAELRIRGFSDLQLLRLEDLDLPAALPALAGRRLRVASACWDKGPRRTQFRLECGEPGECLPFLVYVYDRAGDRGDDPAEGRGHADWGMRAESCGMASGAHGAPGTSPKPLLKPTVRAGDWATAVFVSDRLRMTARVTCLERGREGEVIRVRGEEGNIFRARISGPARLEVMPQ
jgi:flagellar basal body P-ring formation chaperone FlgA